MRTVTLIAAVGAVALVAWPGRSHADPSSSPTSTEHEGPHGSTEDAAAGEHADGAEHAAHEHHYVLGAKGSYAAAIGEHGTHHLGGGGLFFELGLVHGWLELEYGIRAMSDGHLLGFPIDVLLKIPFHASDEVHPFVGLGPTVVPAFDEGLDLYVGGVATVGTYLWPWSWGGFVVEANYALVYEHGLVQEIAGNGGFAYRW